jgi:hypothetical protein
LGLEFLIAGDIIRTVVVRTHDSKRACLGLIVLIRTFPEFVAPTGNRRKIAVAREGRPRLQTSEAHLNFWTSAN